MGQSAHTCSDSEIVKSPAGLNLNPRMHNRRLQYQRSVKCHWALISLSAILIWIQPWLPRANKAFKPHRALIVQTHKPSRLRLQLQWAGGCYVFRRKIWNIVGGNCILWYHGATGRRHTGSAAASKMLKGVLLLSPLAKRGRVSSL